MTHEDPIRTCPECGKKDISVVCSDEEFDFELRGGEIIHVVAKQVPVEHCNSCHLTMSGPVAARIREAAIRDTIKSVGGNPL